MNELLSIPTKGTAHLFRSRDLSIFPHHHEGGGEGEVWDTGNKVPHITDAAAFDLYEMNPWIREVATHEAHKKNSYRQVGVGVHVYLLSLGSHLFQLEG
jgi:hypothetical protein